jgi:predicted dehydrogenase
MTSSSFSLTWALIGAGDVCEHKGGPPLYSVPGHRLAAVYRRDRTLGEDFARRHGPSRYVDSLDALIHFPEVDAVYIATPPSAHCAQTIAAAHAGKHVLVEKPMAMSTVECTRMVEACAKAGVTLGVAYYRRCYPSILRAKDLLESGSIGSLTHIDINDQFPASHRLDLMHFFGGDIASIRSESRELPPHSHARHGERLLGSFVNGASLSMNIGWSESGPPEQLTLTGTEGELFIDDLKGGSLICNGISETFPPFRWTHWGLIENFGLHLQGQADLACSGQEGLKSTAVLDFASTLIAGGDPVQIDYQHPPAPDQLKAAGFNLLG